MHLGSTALKVIRKDRTVFLAVTKVDKITGPPKALWEDPLEEGMATDSSILAWRIPWTEEPGRLQNTTT